MFSQAHTISNLSSDYYILRSTIHTFLLVHVLEALSYPSVYALAQARNPSRSAANAKMEPRAVS